ncbi:MAG TPA: GH32 C-terminal domain-containing protein [Verrucomicrobiales bacterium]|nr:GH32 C-terminal domain-containing protein [Verrucomicrobiales bacterium]
MNITNSILVPAWAGLVLNTACAAEPATPFLKEKTLVTWAAPANLTQRGGSALSLDDDHDHFDGIVFGELAPGKWMAGSDFFRRTEKNQVSFPPETAGPQTVVQIAIIYQGNDITVLRDGKPYSKHHVSAALQEFPYDSVVVMGKRHQRQGDGARFAGAIADARIYDHALTAEEIATLKPDKEDGPKPWAWWTFDDPSGRDRTGRYAYVKLSGGAKVENGKLLLDGKTGYLTARTGPEPEFKYETPARPANPPADWPAYHLGHPGPGNAFPGDPNCAFYWKGRYHLHYIYEHGVGFNFAHVSSEDLIHWKWHPTTLTPPKTGHGMFSGTGFFTKEGRPAIIYHGQGSGRNQVAIALDDSLEKWSEPVAVEPIIKPGQDAGKIANWDPDAWLDGDTYYALSGGIPGSGKPPTLFKSPDLQHWDYLGLFLSNEMPDVLASEDVSCPNFFKIGSKWMLLCISHNKGCRYYLGDWKGEKFHPDFHARMNWHGWDCFAPESVLTPDGRRVMWAWYNPGGVAKPTVTGQTGVQSLPRELSLPADGKLRIKPLRELEQLRGPEKRLTDIRVSPEKPALLAGGAGGTLELEVIFEPGTAKNLGLHIHCNAEGKEGFPILVSPAQKTLTCGTITAPFDLPAGEELRLRVFLDKGIVEVFANDRQAMVATHRAAADHSGVSLVAEGAEALAKRISTWEMKSIYP